MARRLRALVGVALLVTACAGPSPSGSGEGSTAPSSSGAGAVPDEVLAAMADPSWNRLSAVGEDLDAAADTQVGLVEVVGEDVVGWLTDARSAAIADAADAAGITVPALAPARMPDQPVAAVGPMTAFGGEAWFGAVAAGGLGLDQLVSQIGTPNGGEFVGPPLESHSESTQGDLHTVQTTTVTITVSLSGSTVVSQGDATQTSTTTNTQTGSQVATSTYRSHLRATLNACPDPSGIASLTIEITMSDSTSGSAGSSSWDATYTSEIQGQVGEDAWLQSQTEIGNMDVTTTGSDGTTQQGTVSTQVTTSQQPNGGGFGSVTSSQGTSSGTMSASESLSWYSFLNMTAQIVARQGFDKAQEQWRGGKCVRIEATEQGRQVEKNEVVIFTAEPWHRIEGTRLNKKIVATLSGVASVAPDGTPQDPPASITYTAGSQQGDVGSVTLTSTSNRGIGTTTLTFTVGGDYHIEGTRQNGYGANGQVHGDKCDGLDGEWIVNGTYTAMGVFTGTQQWTITLDATTLTGTFTYTDLQTSSVPGAPRTQGQAAGIVSATVDDLGSVHMHLQETSHSFQSETTNPQGGWGADQDAPLQSGDFVWNLGDDC